MPSILNRTLVTAVRECFALDWHGIHGVPHWARVRVNGLAIAAHTGARTDVIELFSFLHDSCRANDGHDPAHGLRAVDFAAELRGNVFDIDAAFSTTQALRFSPRRAPRTATDTWRPTPRCRPAGTPIVWICGGCGSRPTREDWPRRPPAAGRFFRKRRGDRCSGGSDNRLAGGQAPIAPGQHGGRY